MKLFLLALIAAARRARSQPLSIDVDHTSLLQEFYGCGASWTDSSAWLMYGDRSPGDNRALTDSERDAIFSDLFGSNGIALKIVRQPMGTSDFRWSDYTYEDVQGTFSISRDQSYIIPALVRTLAENGQVKVMALPWSPPAWMKQNGSLNGGSLKSDAYDDLGQYFADFVQAYEADGIPIWAVSVQNEPQHEASEYPTMAMSVSQHAQAIVSIRAALDNAIKVVGFDHNWDMNDYPKDLLANYANAKASLNAIAYHCYGQTVPSAQTELYSLHPEVEIFFTECTESGDVSGSSGFNQDFRWALGNLVIGATRNWASTVLEWNLVLSNYGPKISGGCSNCRGLIDIVGWDVGNLQYEKRPAYYALGHLSKFASDGARRIDSSQPDSQTKTVAMINPDQSALLVILNDDQPPRDYNVNWFTMACPVTVPSWSAVTLFRSPGSNSVQVWATYDQGSEKLTRVGDISCTTTGTTPAPIVSPTGAPITPTASPVAPSSSPVAPTTSPVAAPVAPSPSPVAPTSSPVSPTSSPVTPTSSPVGSTPSPMASPTTGGPGIATNGNACCSQNGIDCLHAGHNCEAEAQCGKDEYGCGYVFWLPDGVPVDSSTCTARYQVGCDTKACCPGLGCVSNGCTEIVPISPSSPAPVALTLAPVVAPTTSTVAPTPYLRPSKTPTSAPSAAPTRGPTADPTVTPTFKPTSEPVTVPSPQPTSPPTLRPTAAPVAPTPSPAVPTPSPVVSPTDPGVATTGVACCSQDGVNCLHAGHNCESESKCGKNEFGCGYVFWLPDGVPVDSCVCTHNYQGNCADKACCPGLTCVGSGWKTCSRI